MVINILKTNENYDREKDNGFHNYDFGDLVYIFPFNECSSFDGCSHRICCLGCFFLSLLDIFLFLRFV